MIPYIILYAIIIICSLDSFAFRKKSEIYWLVAIIIICFAAFRGNGFDWWNYKAIYDWVQRGGEQAGGTFIEYGFEFFCKISPTYKSLLVLTGIVSLSMTFAGIYKFSRMYLPVLGLLVFSTTTLLPVYMGQIRQAVAMGFVCLAIYYYYIRHTRTAVLLIIGACFFHVSAILSVLIFFVPRQKLKIKYYILILIISLTLYGVSMALMTQLLGAISIGPVQKLLFYATTEKEELGVSSTILIRVVTLLFAVYVNKDSNPRISYLCNVYLCGIVIYLLFGFIPQLGGRGCYYFVIYEMVLVPYIVYQFRKRHFLFLTAYFMVIALSMYRAISFFSDDFNYISYIPYFQY